MEDGYPDHVTVLNGLVEEVHLTQQRWEVQYLCRTIQEAT